MRSPQELKEMEIANWLQDVLGEDYKVVYDDCESCMTRIYYKPLHKLIKEVPNTEMRTGISATEFEASPEDRFKAWSLR